MGDCAFHRQRAAEALTAARALRQDHPGWALVPLFYSAMHAMHYAFARDGLPDEMQHPEMHTSRRDRSGQIIAWGTLEVVRDRYPGAVSTAFSTLYSAGWATRYSAPMKGDGARLWDAYEVITRYIDHTG